MSRAIATGLALVAMTVTSCAYTSRWESNRRPDALDAAALLAADTLGLHRDLRPDEVAVIPIRERLRPCCAFGSRLRVRLGPMKIPGLRIENIRGPRNIGQHTYDAGRGGDEVFEGSEKNGLIYTCRGGFIDTAHVRDYADWTLFIASEIGRHLETGTVIEFPYSEGADRRIVLQPIYPDLIGIVGRRNLAASLGAWAAFQMSMWHEITTWYGWGAVSGFPERASAFSPEDLYSNLLGIKLVGPIITGGEALSERLFNRAVDAWFAQALGFLGAVDSTLGEQVIAAVDGHWWNSEAPLPDAGLVLRRSVQSGDSLVPWQVSEAFLGEELQRRLMQQCNSDLTPHELRNPSRIPGLQFSEVVTLEIEVDKKLAKRPAFQELGRNITQEDFPRLLEIIREEIRAEFGPLGDSPAL